MLIFNIHGCLFPMRTWLWPVALMHPFSDNTISIKAILSTLCFFSISFASLCTLRFAKESALNNHPPFGSFCALRITIGATKQWNRRQFSYSSFGFYKYSSTCRFFQSLPSLLFSFVKVIFLKLKCAFMLELDFGIDVLCLLFFINNFFWRYLLTYVTFKVIIWNVLHIDRTRMTIKISSYSVR